MNWSLCKPQAYTDDRFWPLEVWARERNWNFKELPPAVSPRTVSISRRFAEEGMELIPFRPKLTR